MYSIWIIPTHVLCAVQYLILYQWVMSVADATAYFVDGTTLAAAQVMPDLGLVFVTALMYEHSMASSRGKQACAQYSIA